MKIGEILEKKFNYETKYQRNDAWTKKIKNLLIDSIMNDYYIPGIIIANNEVVDGKQRIKSIESFRRSEFSWNNPSTNISKKYNDFSWEEQLKFNETEIPVSDLGQISDEKILETFLRINVGSIKLNQAELRLAKALPENREMIKIIANNKNIQKIANNKKNDSRFKIEELITRCIAIIHIPNNKKGIRKFMDVILTELLPNAKIIDSSNKTIDLMYWILNEDTIPIKSFNTIFESIFCAFYENIESKNCFLKNKDIIRKQIFEKIDEINKDQMGGGIKFDSTEFVFKRVNKIKNILEPYKVDKKRLFNFINSLKIWNSKPHICEKCQKIIFSINDFEVDHIQPYTIGGETKIENARILCRQCNLKEGIKIREEMRVY